MILGVSRIFFFATMLVLFYVAPESHSFKHHLPNLLDKRGLTCMPQMSSSSDTDNAIADKHQQSRCEQGEIATLVLDRNVYLSSCQHSLIMPCSRAHITSTPRPQSLALDTHLFMINTPIPTKTSHPKHPGLEGPALISTAAATLTRH